MVAWSQMNSVRQIRRALTMLLLLCYVMTAVHLLWTTLAILKLALPRKTYSHVSKKFVHWFLIIFVWTYERNKGYRTIVTGDVTPEDESALLLSNHPGQDWAPLYSIALRTGLLGCVVPIVKSSLMMIPGFGWSMYLAGSIFLTRKYEKDKLYIQNMMRQLKEDNVPFHIWLFAEGHRFTKKGHESGVQFAKSR
eukprot:g2924.t1